MVHGLAGDSDSMDGGHFTQYRNSVAKCHERMELLLAEENIFTPGSASMLVSSRKLYLLERQVWND